MIIPPGVGYGLVILAALGSAVVIISFDARAVLIGLLLQYIPVAVFFWIGVSPQVALAKSGVNAAVILGVAITMSGAGWKQQADPLSALPTGPGFRAALGAFGVVSGLGLAAQGWLPIPNLAGPAAGVVGVMMVGGLIQVALVQTGYSPVIGLLMAVAGFDLALSHVEQSLAIAGLLSLCQLGLGVAAGYLEAHRRWVLQHERTRP